MSKLSEITEYIKEFDALLNSKADLESDLKEINKRIEEIRVKILPDLMAEEEIRTLTVEGIRGGAGRLSLQSDLRVSIRDKEQGYNWLAESGYDGLIVPYIHPSTLKATIKAAIAEGEEFPEELFNITMFSKAILTKVTKGK